MHRNPATKPLSKVPGHTHLFRRGARYYFRIDVPESLRPIIGRRELVKSLETSEYGLAIERVSVEERTARDILRAARTKLESASNGKVAPQPAEPLIVTSEKHAQELARKWFVEIERQSAHWWTENRQSLTPEERTDLLNDLWLTQAGIVGDSAIHPTNHDDGRSEVRAFLRLNNLTLDEKSEAFSLLARLFREARLEHTRRQTDRIEGKPVRPYETLFRDLNEHSVASPIRQGITLGQLCAQFLAEYEKAGKAPKTIFQYRVTARLLGEVFGNNRAASSISRDDAEKFCTLLETMPEHYAKRYAGKSVEEAIAHAEKRGDKSRLAPNTRRNRFFAAFTMFKFGVETRKIEANPFDDRLLKHRFTPQESRESIRADGEGFTTEELCRIFSAPLYTGCEDDERGYSMPGTNVIRRGRFWVPLIALFQGMRENEICQLHTSDIGEWEGGCFFRIQPGEGKRVKNKPSRRDVPVHPELLRMGFAEFVAKRRADKESHRLFPELPQAKTGSYSDIFSKWFARFLRQVFGSNDETEEREGLRFHSFRHSFTDACRRADLSPQRVDRLCGWAGESRQQRAYGGDKLIAVLAEDLAKVSYPGLNLSHLYASAVQPVARHQCRVRRRRAVEA